MLEVLQAWASALLIYPGALFGALLALVGEWLWARLRTLAAPRPYRTRSKHGSFLQPFIHLLKLTGRRGATRLSAVSALPGGAGPLFEAVLSAVCALAPVLALALMSFPGSPLIGRLPLAGDLFLVLALLSVQPVAKAALRLRWGGLSSLRGAQDIGRLLTGLAPSLLAVGALVEVSGSKSLQMSALAAAPETAAQLLVRFLAGAVLLLALPWWLDGRDTSLATRESAGIWAGKHMEASALAAFWSVLVLPMPGNLAWAIALYLLGALLSYVTMRAISERWAPARRERDAAGLAWRAALPAAIVALGVALVWPGV